MLQLSSKFGAVSDFRVRKLSSVAFPVKNICIVGSGLMGSGIAQVAAQASIMVTLVDKTDAVLNKSKKYIRNNLERLTKKQCKKGVKPEASITENVMEKIVMTTNLGEGVQKADLVIEAVVENLPMKQKLFEQIEAIITRPTLLASNTSSLKLQDIARNLKNKSRFGGLHFFNPVPIMKLCEVVRLTETSDDTFNALQTFAKAVGKTTVECKDAPGFIVNRLLIPYLIEAIRMVERGDASPQDIDTAMKLGAGYPMGPFELLDYVGLDTTKFILDGWHESHPNEKQFDPNPMLNKLVAEGKFGKKSGEGFYSYK
ncbi:hydroxyacyl-coenzyme A dehydrogenase, variant [Loa loa]|uniref:3-hydroxyacyl-CoA dehydrogenase n=1 Tax=Loa loa TaxID=7209 RepID=A0A1S0UM91_LOALO|nr:hydroxyacyl-coenzyme A dehydrogenase [Loa loa]XP_020307334.1 hydroxyacyl-coenzyme A dehydrogenase, variant [Loa loa]EFO22001.1 hydroxyacyl-coenzyme A dehydrogenase [Loa loa]EJD76546.1 hydroxyacyl-coenzyme A dehydrogenase, variant [Loa loa]